MDDTMKQEVRVLAESGLSQRAIAERLGLSRGAVYRALRPERHRPPAPGRAVRRPSDAAEPVSACGSWAGLILLGLLLLLAWREERKRAAQGSSPRRVASPQGGASAPLAAEMSGGPMRLSCGHLLEEVPFYLPAEAAVRCPVCGQIVGPAGS